MYKVIASEETSTAPVDLATLGQWAVEGRIGRDTLLLDVQSGRQFRAEDHPFLSNRLPKLAVAAPPPFLDSRNGNIHNTSGQDGDVPPEVSGWNWGAFGMGLFGLGWLWATNQRITSVFTTLLPFFLLHLYLFVAIGWDAPPGFRIARLMVSVLGFCYWGVAAYLGINGNKLAWKHRQFSDVDDFKACQRAWGWWALGLLVGYILLVAGFLALIVLVRSRA